MRLCRFRAFDRTRWGLYTPDMIWAIDDWAAGKLAHAPSTDAWEDLLPTGGPLWQSLIELLQSCDATKQAGVELYRTANVQMLPPIARPPKLLLLAGNYAEHIREQGGLAAEKRDTFPYVFMKPPSTTLVGSGTELRIPAISPHKIDHEVELAVVIGQRVKDVSAADAVHAIAGYTIINDISDRGFRPNPNRQTRPRDTFFDWLHGKWHDGFCPCGPCFVTADEIADPQNLELTLSIDDDVRQRGSTSQMVFSIAEIIEFVSSFVTLEPGDIISTGTPSGVGNATGRYLQPDTTMKATIAGIGDLITPII